MRAVKKWHCVGRALRAKESVVLPVLSALLGLASCQSYRAKPLDFEGHREAWSARTLEQASLNEFLEQEHWSHDGAEVEFDLSDGLDLREGQQVALLCNPNLRLARLRVVRAAASAEQAGLLADPQFSVMALRITESVPDPWMITPGLQFTLPLSGRLKVQRRIANLGVRTAEWRVAESEWDVWRQVQRAWWSWSASQLRVQATEELVESLRAPVAMTAQLAASGELSSAEASLFALESAQRLNQLERLHGDALAAEQQLRSLLGLTPEAAVEFVSCLGFRDNLDEGLNTALAADVGQRPTFEANFSMARLAQQHDLAEAKLLREIKKQVPDLSLGPAYESEQGQSKIGLSGGLPLPIWNANRKKIAEARVDRDMAQAAFEVQYELLRGRWATAAAGARAVARQRDELQQSLVPMVDQQLERALELLRLGEGTTLVLLQSLTRAYGVKLELIEARLAEGLALTELEYLQGPQLSQTQESTP